MKIEGSMKTTGDLKKTKTLTGIQVLTKDFTSYKIKWKSLRKTKQHSQLNQSTNQLLPLIVGQINLIKFVESNKFGAFFIKFFKNRTCCQAKSIQSKF